MSTPAEACPCGSGSAYEACCGRFHGGEPAVDAECLMRSRYSAYVLGLEDYLRTTWHPDTRPASLGLDATPRPQWLGLTVKSHTLLDARHATVEHINQRLRGLPPAIRLQLNWLGVLPVELAC